MKSQSSIIFKRLLVDSFLSYDREEVFLDELGVVYLKGINSQDSMSESNGSGKSALVAESLIWGLTGNTTRGSSEVSNLYLNRGAYVEIEFEKDGQQYLVRRGTHGSEIGNSVMIERDGVELNTSGKLTTGKAILEDEISDQLNWDVLTSIIVLSQGMGYTLSMYSSKDRRYKLEQLGNVSETFERVSSKVRMEHSILEKSKNDLLMEKSSALGSISVHEARIKEAQAQIARVVEMMHSQTPEDQIKAEILELKTKVTKTDTEINTRINQLPTHQDLLTKAQDNLKVLSDKKSEVSSRYSSKSVEVSKLERDINSYQSEVTSLNSRLESLVASLCSECHQPIDEDEVRTKTELYTAQKLEVESKLSEAIPLLANTKVEVDKLSKEIDKISKDLEPLQSEVTTHQQKVNTLSMEISQYNSTKSSHQLRISQLESSLNSVNHNYDTSEYESQVLSSQAQVAELHKVITSIDESISKVDTSIALSQWIQSKTARDIRAYLLRGVVQYLNTRCMEYSEMLFDTMRVQMKIDKSDIHIYLGDRLIESVSGGERRRADIVIQLALRDLVLIDSGLYSNLLVVDEALDYLDNSGVSHVLDLLTTQRATVGSIILITHKTDADINYDRVWTVEKSVDGISRLI